MAPSRRKLFRLPVKKKPVCRRCREEGTAMFPREGGDIILCDDCVVEIVRGYFQLVRHEDPDVWDALVRLVDGA